jgi:transcriptional regulator of acetoin/glycerol metabolism
MKGYGEKRMRPPAASILPASASQGVVIGGPAAPSAGKRGAPTADELKELLVRHKGNIAAVGRELGKERMQIHRWLKKYEIDLDRYREE